MNVVHMNVPMHFKFKFSSIFLHMMSTVMCIGKSHEDVCYSSFVNLTDSVNFVLRYGLLSFHLRILINFDKGCMFHAW